MSTGGDNGMRGGDRKQKRRPRKIQNEENPRVYVSCNIGLGAFREKFSWEKISQVRSLQRGNSGD